MNKAKLILRKRTVRMIVAAYLALFMVGTTFPGATLFNQVEPLVIGLPFNLFMLALLIVIALMLLIALYISETRSQD